MRRDKATSPMLLAVLLALSLFLFPFAKHGLLMKLLPSHFPSGYETVVDIMGWVFYGVALAFVIVLALVIRDWRRPDPDIQNILAELRSLREVVAALTAKTEDVNRKLDSLTSKADEGRKEFRRGASPAAATLIIALATVLALSLRGAKRHDNSNPKPQNSRWYDESKKETGGVKQ